MEGTDVELVPGKRGEFEILAADETVARRGGNWLTRSFGAGYPDPEAVVAALERRRGAG